MFGFDKPVRPVFEAVTDPAKEGIVCIPTLSHHLDIFNKYSDPRCCRMICTRNSPDRRSVTKCFRIVQEARQRDNCELERTGLFSLLEGRKEPSDPGQGK